MDLQKYIDKHAIKQMVVKMISLLSFKIEKTKKTLSMSSNLHTEYVKLSCITCNKKRVQHIQVVVESPGFTKSQ